MFNLLGNGKRKMDLGSSGVPIQPELSAVRLDNRSAQA